jgi:Fe2+ or Zn2+ uptake regulation protein/O6-methylguanine-DNA--protein-cysteine methyltransferase
LSRLPGVPRWRIGKHAAMTLDSDPGESLRSRGLRVTPQRRAILGAFSHAAAEHLSADEIHARAAAAVPELGRGTVYATLAELTELGILIARGSPEPVRYETNTTPHQHFRCRVCLRLFDVEIPDPSMSALGDAGFAVEQVTVVAEGVCAECRDYDQGLRAGVKRARSTPTDPLPGGLAAAKADSPVGTLTLGATPDGLVRVVFDDHADVPRLHEAIRSHRGSRAAREHLKTGKAAIADYFAGRAMGECDIDWQSLPDADTLHAAMAAPRGQDVSYETLQTPTGAEARGRALGSNPLAIIVPCHRITRGRQSPGVYVGGVERLRALRELERT